jgi:predicted nucleotidyltransferase
MCRPVQRRFGISEARIAAIREWAERTRYLASLRLFGSRLKGRARIDSDLDIAIDAANERYIALTRRWEAELQELTGLRAAVRHYKTDKVREYCDEFSVLDFPEFEAR